MLNEVCRRLQGTYSVIAFNGNSPNQLVTFRDSKPAELLLIKSLSMMLIASDKDYLRTALYRYNKYAKLYMPILEGAKFPLITSSDVEFLTMPDDTAAIFNLAKNVEKDTKVEDVFEKVKIPRQDRLWKKGATTYRAGNSNYNAHNAATKKAENDKQEAAKKMAEAAKKATEAKRVGEARNAENEESAVKEDKTSAYVWDKTKESFAKVEGVEDARKLGSIELGVEDNNVTTLSSDDGPSGIALEESTEEEIDTLVGGSAGIEDEPFPEGKSLYDDSTVGTTVEVDASVDTEAMEIARESASILPKYENNEDLLDELDIATKANLVNMPLYALANRIAKTVYQKGYYKGFIKKRGLRKKTLEVVKKKNKAEENIKALKIMTKILSTTAARSALAISRDLKNDVLKATDEVIDKGEILSIKDIESIFSTGDFRNNETLRLVKEAIFEKIGG